jgi:hypothetical protein
MKSFYVHQNGEKQAEDAYSVSEPFAVSCRSSFFPRMLEEDFDSLNWVKDTTKIIEYLDNVYSDKLPTQATSLSPLLVIAQKLWPSDQRTYEALFKRYTAVRKAMEDARPAQHMSEREAKN